MLQRAPQPLNEHVVKASTQKLSSMVFDKRHDNTARLHQSITAVRYRNPRAIGM
jgi:hypothetical protein